MTGVDLIKSRLMFQKFKSSAPSQPATSTARSPQSSSSVSVQPSVPISTAPAVSVSSTVALAAQNPSPAPLTESTNVASISLSSSTPSSSTAQGLYEDFPDGQLSCDTFPSDYGPISLDYLNLQGWSGIQCPNQETSSGFADIQTKIAGSSCDEGDFCSYACPPGYQKTQWPTTQGNTGQSIGGLQCQNGKLRLTNPGLSHKLCTPGSTAIPINVQNTMNECASICRTDYPGTESETIPLEAQPGTTSNLTCPDASTYFVWEGKSTSAQYYVNPKGVSSQQACQWGSQGQSYGNYAPVNFGVGYDGGQAWLSIFPNKPTSNATLDFSVEIVGNGGGYDNLGARCKYQDGQFRSGDNYEVNNPNGCTVGVPSGTATFVLSS